MKQIQIEYVPYLNNDNAEILRVFKKRLYPGWYTVSYRGVCLDKSTVCAVERNPNGEIK